MPHGNPGDELQQTSYVFKADTHPEATNENNLAAKNTPIIVNLDTNYRVRTLVRRVSGNSVLTDSLRCQRKRPGQSWRYVNDSDGVVRVSDSPHFVDGDHTTPYAGRLGAGTWADSTNSGLVDTGDGYAGPISFPSGSNDMELELCFQLVRDGIVTQALWGVELLFRWVRSGGSLFELAYLQFPTVYIQAKPGEVTYVDLSIAPAVAHADISIDPVVAQDGVSIAPTVTQASASIEPVVVAGGGVSIDPVVTQASITIDPTVTADEITIEPAVEES